jgi:hypothetical protein
MASANVRQRRPEGEGPSTSSAHAPRGSSSTSSSGAAGGGGGGAGGPSGAGTAASLEAEAKYGMKAALAFMRGAFSAPTGDFADAANEERAAAGVTDDFVERNESKIPALILLVSFATRFYRLADPPGVVFDEYHFGRFVNQYNAGTYLFDIHPPLGKLVLVFAGWLFGYDHTKCQYNNIQDHYNPECKYLVLRSTAALFGTFTTPILYQVVRNWGGSVWAALLCASFFLMDNLNLTESRLVLIDSQLIFWCAASLLVAQMWWRRLDEHEKGIQSWAGRFGCEVSAIDDERTALAPDGCPTAVEVRRGGDTGPKERVRISDPGLRAQCAKDLSLMMGERERLMWVVLVGVSTSSALSVKWTTLATPGMIALESFFGFFFLRVSSRRVGKRTSSPPPAPPYYPFPFPSQRKPAPLYDLIRILVVAFSLYYLWFAVHFAMLPNTGDGDAFMRVRRRGEGRGGEGGKRIMCLGGAQPLLVHAPLTHTPYLYPFSQIEFQRTLVNNTNYDPLAPHPGYFTTFFQLNAEMLSANARIDVRHNWESLWWEWPLNLRGLLYYSQDKVSPALGRVEVPGSVLAP